MSPTSSAPLRILVGIDFSPSSDLALSQALRLAERLPVRLDLVHVCHTPVTILPELVMTAQNDMVYVAEARKELEEVRARVEQAGVPVEAHLRVGDATSGLLEMIGELRPDLVIVGSHGRGAFARALLGSVTDRLCRRSPVPVMIVPAPGRAEVAAQEVEPEPAVGEAVAQDLTPAQLNDPAELFPTAPPGGEGYSVNPELRVRY